MRKLDRTDIGILNSLQQNARITNADLARSVNLTPTPCFNRVKAMEERGLIREQVTLLDADMLGLHVNVFIHVSLEKQVEEALQHFEAAISDRHEVMECYLMAGDPDYLIRVLVPSIQALERFMMDFLTKVPGVANIRSSFALKQVRYKTALPLPPDSCPSPSAPTPADRYAILQRCAVSPASNPPTDWSADAACSPWLIRLTMSDR